MRPEAERAPDQRVYLVGGAVRDELLGIAHKERDWVVVGSTPEALLEKGYKQVGASFPVFLHPGTGEEYALARTEKKQGHGYHGFAVDFHPGVTLEEDLARRDLTINAMARSADGVLTDPYGGKADLESRVLRHVSPAFSEDPLRVLRVARFAARFAPLGFTVHPSTLRLMREITGSGELSQLVPERVWGEIESALSRGQPGVFIEVLRQCGALSVLLPEVDVLFGVPQPAKYHPEIDTGIHVIMTMNLAARLGWSAKVVFALLLHDLGKGVTDPANWPSHVGHERAGVPLVERVCERYRVPGAYRDLALKVCALHLRCHRLMEMQPSRVMALLEDADLLRRPEQMEQFVQACEADYRGRKGSEERKYPQAHRLAVALEAGLSIKARQLDTAGLDGRAIGELLRRSRIEAISRTLHQ
ncbi:MAG: multifunctional CCA addition/repair protein [Xanthomonadales bacterium]